MAKVLLVDDDEGTRTWMAAALTGAGHQVRTADGARTARVDARAFQPDLVVADILMPDVDGFALADEIQRDRPVPVMFVSIGRFEAEAILRGAAGYVSKPITARELRSAVDKVLGATTTGLTVLVVDDDPSIRQVYRLMLEPRFRVIEAANGQQALDRLAEEPVGLALVDVHMPVMNGVELVRTMRADPRWRELPVIVQTTDAASLRAPVWVDLHVEQVLDKAEFIDWLLARVDSHIAETEVRPTRAQPL